MKLCIAAGTRPEAIKLAPVHLAASARPGWRSIWVASGQHGSGHDRAQEALGVEPALVLEPPCGDDSLAGRLAHMIARYDRAFADLSPDMVLVQGDTSTTIAASLAAFSAGIPFGHVEAGLRTFDLAAPFPEEGWRCVVGRLAALHFAPTERAARNLAREGVPSDIVHVTGNTGIDALRLLAAGPPPACLEGLEGRRLVTLTLHRRENWNGALDAVAQTVRRLRDRFEDCAFLFVSHANPVLANRARDLLAGEARVTVSPPLDYPDFVAVMRASCLILSDSGGVQEEAPAFGVPVLVLREVTERVEAVEAGVARLVGACPHRIYTAAAELLSDPKAYAAMSKAANPFGDGRSAARIIDLVARWAHDRAAGGRIRARA